MAKKSETAVEKTNQALARPSYVENTSAGTDHITKDDLQMPRLALAQKMSPELVDTDPKYVDGLRVGHLFNNLTKEVYGKGPIPFCVVRADRPRGVEFRPLSEGGGIIDFRVPVDDPRMQFTVDDEGKSQKPRATKFYDYIVMLLDDDHKYELIALSLKGTGLKVARQLNALMKLRQAPVYAGMYTLTTSMAKNNFGEFAVYQVQNAEQGWLDEETYKRARSVFESIKDKEFEIEREHPGMHPDDPDAEREPEQM